MITSHIKESGTFPASREKSVDELRFREIYEYMLYFNEGL